MYMFWRSSYPMGLTKMLYNQTGSEKSNMAAFKPEVPISKLVDKIGMKVQRLCIYFQGSATQWDYQKCCTTKLEVRNPILRHSNRKYQYPSL